MHPSSMNNMRKVRETHLNKFLSKNIVVCDVGGIYNSPEKTYKNIFADLAPTWYIADIVQHPTVTHKMSNPYVIDLPSDSVDLVVSGQMLEHCSNPFKMVAEMKRIVKPNGFIVIIAPSTGPAHDAQDGWRFLKDAFRFITEDVQGIEIVADWIDTNAPDRQSQKWNDHVFVGRKQ